MGYDGVSPSIPLSGCCLAVEQLILAQALGKGKNI